MRLETNLESNETVKQPKPLVFDEIIESCKELARSRYKVQDFILITGDYRISYFARDRAFVVEQRVFEKLGLNGEEE